jgi:hypothetical protein
MSDDSQIGTEQEGGSVERLPFEDVWGMPPASISWDITPPYEVKGVVEGQELAQQLDITTRKPLVWDDGRPRKKIIITLATDIRDPENPSDDGRRQMHVKIPSGLFAAIRDALKAADARTLMIGHRLSVTYTSDGKAERKGMSPPKEYAALIESAGEAPF